MKNHFTRLIAAGLFLYTTTSTASVEVYPWPATVPNSDKYRVIINQGANSYEPKALYSEPVLIQGPDGDGVTGLVEDRSLTYVPFAFTGEIEVEVTKLYGTAAPRVEVVPKSYGIDPTYFDGTTVKFQLNHNNLPAYVSVNFVTADNQDAGNNGAVVIKNGLVLFGDLPETNAPDLSNAVNYVNATRSQIENADLLYFPPGDHHLKDKLGEVNGQGTDARIYFKKNGQHLYMAPGAFIRGSIKSNGHDFMKISGRGVITGEDFYWHYFQEPGSAKGKTAFLN